MWKSLPVVSKQPQQQHKCLGAAATVYTSLQRLLFSSSVVFQNSCFPLSSTPCLFVCQRSGLRTESAAKLYDQLKVFVLDAREMYVECFSEVKCAQSCFWATLDVRPVSKVAEVWLVFHARRCVTMLFCSFHTDALFFLSYLWRGAIYVVLHFS